MAVPVIVVAAAKSVFWRRVRRLLVVLVPLVGAGLLAAVLLMAVLAGGSSTQQQAPGSIACPGATLAAAGAIKGLSAQQAANARTIVAVGRELGVPAYGWVIAVATAMQESTLVNVPYGDRDSVGLFQQRTAWGSTAQRMDPATSARMFYTGGGQGQPGLMQIKGFERLPLTVAAQSVQRSAFPTAYAKWQPLATEFVGDPSVLSAGCYSETVFASDASDGSTGGTVVAAALKMVGVPYSWGGGTLDGPGPGFGSGAGVVGFDCSSLSRYAWHQAGITLPRVASAQYRATQPVSPDPKAWRAGDLVFLHAPGDPAGFYHHVAIYDGQGGVIHAPRPGRTVEVVHDFLSVPYWRGELASVRRPANRLGPGLDAGQDG